MHHPQVDIERFNVKRENGGREFIHLGLTYKTTTAGFKK